MENLVTAFSDLSVKNFDSTDEENSKCTEKLGEEILSTCYDDLFDVSTIENDPTVLISDDGRLRLFRFDSNGKFSEENSSKNKILNEQIQTIVFSSFFSKFLVLTQKSLNIFDSKTNLVRLELEIEKNSPPFWRMTCFSSDFFLNLGLGASIIYFKFGSTPLKPIRIWSRNSLNYKQNDLISNIFLNSQSVLAMNVELEENLHVIDLFSFKNCNDLEFIRRIDGKSSCPLDVVCSLPKGFWFCKSHWPSDDSICLVEPDGKIQRVSLEQRIGYVVNFRLTADRSKMILIRTASKLPKLNEQIEKNLFEDDDSNKKTSKREIIGKLPSNLVLEVYRFKTNFE